MTKRHRGDKQKRRFGRLVFIILLSLAFLLFVAQWSFQSVPLVQ